MLDGERLLLEALLEVPAVIALLGDLGAEIRSGAGRLNRVLRNEERGSDLARRQRRRLLRALTSARELVGATEKDGARLRRRLAARLADIRLHPSLVDRLEGVARRAEPPWRNDAALRRAEQARSATLEAKTKLVASNLRLVVKLAASHRNRGLPFLDLVQEGNIGLMHGVDKFDPRKGHRLTTYASWWIKQSIERALADHGPTIRVPVHLVENRSRVARARRRLYAVRGVDPSASELSERTGVPLAKVETIFALPREPLSLETPLGPDGDLRLGDVVADDSARAPEEAAEGRELTRHARSLLDTLGERERHVVLMRFGLDGAPEQTLEEIGQELSLTRERVRQIETSALAKLRARWAERLETCGLGS